MTRKQSADRELVAFVQRVKLAYNRLAISQNELARRLGTGPMTVSDLFSKNTKPHADIVLRMPEVLNVSGHWLLTGQGSMLPEGSGSAAAFEAGGVTALQLVETAIQNVRAEWTGSGKAGPDVLQRLAETDRAAKPGARRRESTA